MRTLSIDNVRISCLSVIIYTTSVTPAIGARSRANYPLATATPERIHTALTTAYHI